MAKNIKHLIKIYDEYKKIKGYYDGELVAPKDVVNALRTSVGGKPLDEEQVEPKSTPIPQYTPSEDEQRKEKRKSFGYADGGLVPNSEVSQYLKNDQSQDNSNKNSSVTAPAPTTDKLKSLAGSYGLSNGGKVEKPHNKQNLKKLKESFDSFLQEEGYYDGGPVQGYADGEEVESDPMAGNVSPEQYQANLEALKQQGLKLPQNIEGNEQLVDSDMNRRDKSEDTKSAEDKLIEEPYADEDLEAEIKSSPEEDNEDNDSGDEESDVDLDKNQVMLAGKQESKPEPKKESDSKEEKPEQLQYTPSQSNGLADAQRQRDLGISAQGFAKYAALAGAGASKTDPSRILGIIGDQDKYVNLPVEKYKEQIENQKNDPNSEYSKQYAAYAAQVLGIDPSKLKGMSGVALDKIVPIGLKKSANDFAITKLFTQQAGANKRNANSVSGANARADKRNDILQQQVAQKNESNGLNKEQKASNDQNRSLAQTQQLLESARGNPAAAQAEKDLYASQKANSLYNMYKDPNQANNSMFQLYATEIAKMASGGVPSIHELQGLNPTTIPSYLATSAEKFSSEPTPANKGAFMTQFKKYSDALASDAQKVIKDKYSRVIEPRRKQLGEDNYNALQDQYVNRFKSSTEAPAVDADLNKMNPEQLKAYIQAHGGQ